MKQLLRLEAFVVSAADALLNLDAARKEMAEKTGRDVTDEEFEESKRAVAKIAEAGMHRVVVQVVHHEKGAKSLHADCEGKEVEDAMSVLVKKLVEEI